VFLTATVYMQNATTFALQVRDLGFTPQVYGLLQAMNGVLVVIFELPVAAWAQHRDRALLIALGGLLVGAAFTSLTVVQALPGLLLMVVVWTFGEIVESPATSAFVADRAPEHARGRYQASLGMMFASSAIIGPLAGTAVFATSPTALWLGCGVISLGAAGLALAARRHPTPRLQDPPLPGSG
jgi:MFS family permease